MDERLVAPTVAGSASRGTGYGVPSHLWSMNSKFAATAALLGLLLQTALGAKARRKAVKMHLPFAPKAEEERYRLQFLCDLTDEEIREAQQSQRDGRLDE